MGRNAWLAVCAALTLGCSGAIGDRDPAQGQRNLDGGTPRDAEVDATPDGSTADGSIPDAGAPDAGPSMDAGLDAGPGGDAGPCADGPLTAPLANCQPDPLPSTGDDHADCVARINQLRWACQCLPPLARWSDGEACADGNAEYDSIHGIHASFYDQACGSGARAQNECPGWPSLDSVIGGCLQQMWDEGPEDGDPNTVNGHYESMASSGYTQVACGFFTTTSGQVWAVQNFD